MPIAPKTFRQLTYKPLPDCRPSASKRGYNNAWQKIRQYVLLRDNYTCQQCKRVIGSKKGECHVDHIKALSKGGTNDMDNLQTLCNTCHSIKTAREDGGFGKRG
jgi:5-methylcytosine-specific restriction protein A